MSKNRKSRAKSSQVAPVETIIVSDEIVAPEASESEQSAVIVEAPIVEAPIVEAPIVEAPIVEAPIAPTVAAAPVKRAMQSIAVGADTAHDDELRTMTARIHALDSVKRTNRDLFGARLHSRTEAVNTALICYKAPTTIALLAARTLCKNVNNDLRAKSNGAITVLGADGAQYAVVESSLGAWRLTDAALAIVKRELSDAPCLVMLRDDDDASGAAVATNKAPVAPISGAAVASS
jgi:hypothetical protein